MAEITLAQLRKSNDLQAHHWRTIEFCLLARNDGEAQAKIRQACIDLCHTSECYGMEPLAVVETALGADKISADPKTLGVFREALNAINRIRRRQ